MLTPVLRLLALGSSLLTIAFVGGCASGIRQLDTTRATRMTLASLREAAQGKRLAAALQGGAQVLVHARAGQTIPLKLASQLGPLTLVAGQNALRCEHDLYLYIANRELLLGPDGRRWARVGDWRALKSLFGMRRGGTLKIGFGVHAGQGPAVDVVFTSNGLDPVADRPRATRARTR